MELDREKADVWINTEKDPVVRAIKEKIIANLHYVSAAEFKAALIKATVFAFGRIRGSYAVIWDYKPHSSKRWVYHQIKSILHKYQKPVYAGYYTQSVDNILGVALNLLAKNVQNIVIFDDASYSGEQLLRRILNPMFKFFASKGKRVKFHIIVPYATNRSVALFTSHEADVQVYNVHVMKTLLEILSKDEIEVLKSSDREEFRYLGATLTYFDHRVADNHSFFEEVANLMKQKSKPYRESDSRYSTEEKAEWDLYWKKYLDYLASQRNED